MVVTQHPTHHERGKVANKMIFVAVCTGNCLFIRVQEPSIVLV